LLLCIAGAALAVSAAVTSIGCDSSTFLPPPPDGLRGASEDTSSNDTVAVPPALEGSSVGARSIEMILDRREPAEIDAVKAAARMQAGIDKVKLRTTVLGDQDLPANQVDLVREAVARNALALIVEPADPTDTRMAEVLERAREEGIPVVLLNRPLGKTGSSDVASKGAESAGTASKASSSTANTGANPKAASAGAKPTVLVAPASFAESAQQLVDSAIRNAKNAKLDPKGGAVIVINTIADPFFHERAQAIRDALKKSGITAIEEITFSKSAEGATKQLTEKLKANPKLVLAFSIDPVSTGACREVVNNLIPERPFVLSAYASETSVSMMTKVGDYAAVALFVPTRVVRKAITTAVNLAQGGNVPSRVEVPIDMHDSPEDSALAQSPARHRTKPAAKTGP
jgi:ABC-type sugar transport system substrate-binding protein